MIRAKSGCAVLCTRPRPNARNGAQRLVYIYSRDAVLNRRAAGSGVWRYFRAPSSSRLTCVMYIGSADTVHSA